MIHLYCVKTPQKPSKVMAMMALPVTIIRYESTLYRSAGISLDSCLLPYSASSVQIPMPRIAKPPTWGETKQKRCVTRRDQAHQ